MVCSRDWCNYLAEAYKELYQSEDNLVIAYKNALFRLNETVLFKKGTRSFTGTIKGVTEDGHLVINNNHVEESFAVGEIEWLI